MRQLANCQLTSYDQTPANEEDQCGNDAQGEGHEWPEGTTQQHVAHTQRTVVGVISGKDGQLSLFLGVRLDGSDP